MTEYGAKFDAPSGLLITFDVFKLTAYTEEAKTSKAY